MQLCTVMSLEEAHMIVLTHRRSNLTNFKDESLFQVEVMFFKKAFADFHKSIHKSLRNFWKHTTTFQFKARILLALICLIHSKSQDLALFTVSTIPAQFTIVDKMRQPLILTKQLYNTFKTQSSFYLMEQMPTPLLNGIQIRTRFLFKQTTKTILESIKSS